jgi:hypothetical protein
MSDEYLYQAKAPFAYTEMSSHIQIKAHLQIDRLFRFTVDLINYTTHAHIVDATLCYC